MSVYLIEVDDTKQGVMCPTSVGPFESEDAALAFAEEMQMGRVAETLGGYSAVHVVSDSACDHTPDGYREAYAWRLDEDLL